VLDRLLWLVLFTECTHRLLQLDLALTQLRYLLFVDLIAALSCAVERDEAIVEQFTAAGDVHATGLPLHAHPGSMRETHGLLPHDLTHVRELVLFDLASFVYPSKRTGVMQLQGI
jgi:hypothetical protein